MNVPNLVKCHVKLRNLILDCFFQIITYGSLNSTVEGGVLQSLQETLSKVYLPLMKSYKDWGDLDTIPGGDKLKKHFVENVEQFVQTLKSK